MASLPEWASVSSSELCQQPSLEGGVNCGDRTFGGRPSTLTVENERTPAVLTCRADCLTCPALILENKVVSNTTDRKYFAIYIKLDEVLCKLQNSIYLLTCAHSRIQYVGESIAPLNLRMNIERRGKSGCEISIDHYTDFGKMQHFKSKSFKNYHEMVTNMEQKIMSCQNIDFNVKVTGWKDLTLSTLTA